MDAVTIDGSLGEGGGQVLRTATALAARTRTPVTVTNIRANRPRPGLRPQHVAALDAVRQACDGRLDGAEVGAQEVTLEPGALRRGTVTVDTGTAASTTLVLQALVALAPGLPGPLTLDALGGTDTKWAPTLVHTRDVLAHHAARAGVALSLETVRHGFYPVGGGRLRVRLEPVPAAPWAVRERGPLDAIEVRVRSAGLPDHVGERVSKSAARVLQHAGHQVRRSIETVEANSPGVVVDAVATFEHTVLGANALGERGVRSEDVGRACGERLLAELASGATLDVHAADQVVPLLYGRGGAFVVRELTGHLETNLAVCAHLVEGAHTLEPVDGGTLVHLS